MFGDSNPTLRKTFLLIGDVLLLYFSLSMALVIGFWKNFNSGVLLEHLFPFTILYAFWLTIFYIFGLYDLDVFKNRFLLYAKILACAGICLVFGTTFFYLIPLFGITPKTNLSLNIIIFGILALCWREIFGFLFASHFQNKLAIIGKNNQSKELVKIIKENPHIGYKFVIFFDPKKNIFEQIKKQKIDTLVLAEKSKTNSMLLKNLYQCLPLKLNFMDLAQAYETIAEKIPASFVTQAWFLENLKERKKKLYEKTKRITDIALSLIIILITSPLLPFIALAIKINDKGPIFYSQKRIGKNGNTFLLLKFRSMIKNAENKKAIWAKKEDSRITKVGKFLRKSHIDELPQMFNTLKGDISLIGPRPERPEFVDKLEKEIPYYHIRHLIKPGFTGWAQIKFRYGRSITDSYEKFQYDLYYLKNRSIPLDIKIALRTFQLFFKRE